MIILTEDQAACLLEASCRTEPSSQFQPSQLCWRRNASTSLRNSGSYIPLVYHHSTWDTSPQAPNQHFLHLLYRSSTEKVCCWSPGSMRNRIHNLYCIYLGFCRSLKSWSSICSCIRSMNRRCWEEDHLQVQRHDLQGWVCSWDGRHHPPSIWYRLIDWEQSSNDCQREWCQQARKL